MLHINRNKPSNEQVPGKVRYTYSEEGQLYFVRGKTRIKVTEHFPDQGKAMEELMTDVILFSARQKPEQDLPKAA